MGKIPWKDSAEGHLFIVDRPVEPQDDIFHGELDNEISVG
jgi:hypothetical protein